MDQHTPTAILNAWNAEYRERGKLYGGAPFPLPDLPQGSRVLDLGCGNGKHLHAMEAKGWTVVGIDIAGEAIRLCQRIHPLIIGDACVLPFKDASFHAIIGIHILGHLPGQVRPLLINEAFRALKDGGRFHCTVFSRGDMRCGKGEEILPFTHLRRGIMIHYFTEKEVGELKGPFQEETVSCESHPVRFSGEWYTREYIKFTYIKE
ncbi:MAG: Methyltransferase, putative [Methanomicrobiales archaeon 53_19]|nr:MAG: Methyltransferase, putative [Methanomicrobiales archaeon 53_19]